VTGALIAWSYAIIAFIVAVIATRYLRADYQRSFPNDDDKIGEVVHAGAGGFIAGAFWPIFAVGFVIWRIAFPPRAPESVEDEL
jgi:hypothetical protein